LFKDNSANAEIKVVDFGFAARLLRSEKRHMRTNTPLGMYRAIQLHIAHIVFTVCASALMISLSAYAGTLGYAAPEIFSGQPYSETCDVWSIGVITYILYGICSGLAGVGGRISCLNACVHVCAFVYVCMMIRLSGVPPFCDPTEYEADIESGGNTPFWVYVNRMQNARGDTSHLKLQFPDSHWKHVSEDGNELPGCGTAGCCCC